VYKKKNQVLIWQAGILLLMPLSVYSNGCMSIHTAARAGNVDEVNRQLAWGVNPNTRTFPWYLDTPLHFAAAYGRTEVVKLFLEKGANVNKVNEGGETPLHYATRHLNSMDAQFRMNFSKLFNRMI